MLGGLRRKALHRVWGLDALYSSLSLSGGFFYSIKNMMFVQEQLILSLNLFYSIKNMVFVSEQLIHIFPESTINKSSKLSCFFFLLKILQKKSEKRNKNILNVRSTNNIITIIVAKTNCIVGPVNNIFSIAKNAKCKSYKLFF